MIDYHLTLDYLRMVCYAIIFMSSLRGIAKRKFSNVLYLGDIIMCIALFTTLLLNNFFHHNLFDIADFVITPAVIIWAGIHFKALLEVNHDS